MQRIKKLFECHYVLQLLYAFVGYCFTLSIFIFRWDIILDSDMSSELVLAHRLAQNGGILDKSWYYASELRVLNTQLVYKFFFQILGEHWRWVRFCSVATFMLMIALTAFYLLKMLNVQTNIAILCAGTLIWPFSPIYALIALYGAYYVPHICINFLVIALLIHCYREVGQKSRLYWVLCLALMVLSFCSGLGGVRQIMLTFAPLGITCLFLFVMNRQRKDMYGFYFTYGMAAFFAVTGYFVNHFYLSVKYFFTDMSAIVWHDWTLSDILNCLSTFLKLTGYRELTSVVSLAGGANFLVLFVDALFVIVSICLLARVGKLAYERQVVVLYAAIAIVMHAFIFVASEDIIATHWIPLVPFVFIILAIAYDEFAKDLNVLQRVVTIGVLVSSVALSSFFVWQSPRRTLMDHDFYYLNPGMRGVEKWVDDRGFTQGISTYWGSNVITEYSNGTIEMWTVELDPVTVFQWLQGKEHSEKLPEGRVFFLLTQYEMENSQSAQEIAKRYPDHLVYHEDRYYIYEFEDIASEGIIVEKE